jgi:hypothetical protein
VACSVVWVAGSRSWLVGPLLAGMSRVMCRPFCCFRGSVVGRHSFMARSCGDDMTKLNFLRGSSSATCFLRGRHRALIACLSGQRGCAHCAHVCARVAFRPAFWTLPPGSASPLHEVLCCRRHDFAAWYVGFVGRSGFSGNVFVGIGVRAVDRAQVCGIRNFFRRSVIPVH